MGKHISVATIDSPEFINLQPMEINPLMSKCEIKVLYIGQNRNGSAISKAVATEMSKTLRGCPIVGYFIEKKEDFGDHGDQVIIDAEGVKFNKLTKPYGFVAPDAKVWFKFFEDQDDFGNTCVREYLMTEGYLWTGQFEEAMRVIENGNPQSMELDEKTLKGYWSTDSSKGIDFFIINDATFSSLCILGEDTEPCFEGASITAPDVSSNFSKDDDFTKSLFTMMSELRYALTNSEGGLSMENTETTIVENQETAVEEPVENFSNEEGKDGETVINENDNSVEKFAKKDDKEESEKESEEGEKEEDKNSEDKPEEKKDDKEKEDDSKKKYELLQNDFEELKTKFASLEEENAKLLAFKQEVENKQKDDLIASFYMLSDEDKQDVVTNKAQYSLEDIEAKLSVICVRKKVNFDLDNTSEQANENTAPITYNLDSHQADSLPAWLRAVEDVRNRNK